MHFLTVALQLYFKFQRHLFSGPGPANHPSGSVTRLPDSTHVPVLASHR
jgi:hypothetical protein